MFWLPVLIMIGIWVALTRCDGLEAREEVASFGASDRSGKALVGKEVI